MTDFTREALIDKLRVQLSAWLSFNESTEAAHACLDAILANARILPPEVTDEMVGAFVSRSRQGLDIAERIDAAIDAGKL